MFKRRCLPFVIACCIAGPVSHAQELSSVINNLMQKSPRTKASTAEIKANYHRKVERNTRNRAPNIDVDTNYGAQVSGSFGQNSVREADASGYNVRFTQLLADFGRSSEALKESEKIQTQSEHAFEAAKQGLLLEALSAYLSVQRAKTILDSAKKAEANIKEQARLENALVVAGKGYGSDVLHAKAQLASAEARRVRAEGSLEIAHARVKAVFGVVAPDVEFLQTAEYKPELLPSSLDLAMESSKKNNSQLKIGDARSTALHHRLKSVRIEENAPKVEAVTQLEKNWNAAGVLRRERDDRFMIKVSWDNNLGGAETHRIASVQQELEASRQREQETSQLVEEQVQIAWRNLDTARLNRNTIANQVELARLFLNAARQERTAGRRSLLDVLSAETRVTDAEADLAATEFDLKIAAFTLLQAVGLLDEASVLYSALPQSAEAPASLKGAQSAQPPQTSKDTDSASSDDSDGTSEATEEASELIEDARSAGLNQATRPAESVAPSETEEAESPDEPAESEEPESSTGSAASDTSGDSAASIASAEPAESTESSESTESAESSEQQN